MKLAAIVKRSWISAVAVAAVIVLLAALDSPPPGMPERYRLSVARGDTFQSVARALKEAGVIRSALFLDALTKVTGSGGSLQAGDYDIERGASAVGIHALLTSGKERLERVTIPEGWTASQIAGLLERDHVTSRGEFLAAIRSPALLRSLGIPGATAQGYLFPDTYDFPPSFPAERVVRIMVANFFESLGKIEPDYRTLSPSELHDKVVMASVVEREYRVPAEAPEIASVFYNRLRKRMRLQSCATVAYVLTDVLGEPHRTRLFDKDLAVKSDYNTYLHRGLPPEAISNPGLISLGAAFHPASTAFLYFVLSDPATGAHFFSRSFTEHTFAKFQYLSLYLKTD